MRKRVAVTGTLASGKSSFCQTFRKLGAEVISADQIVNQLLSTDKSLKARVVELLGEEVIQLGEIDKSKVASLVFSDRKKLKQLEEILHPAVLVEIENRFESCEAPLFVVEIPLLFEANLADTYDITVAVVAKEPLRLKRYIESKDGSTQDFYKRQENQLSQEEKAACADTIIENNGSLAALEAQALFLFNQLIAS